MTCSSCKMSGSETSFHICRECTIQHHEYDIHTFIDQEPSIHPDAFTICSTCVLKDHNTTHHTVIEYLPIRLNYQLRMNTKSADVLKTRVHKDFSDAMTILSSLPILVKKKECEVAKIAEFMTRAKNTESLTQIFKTFEREMKNIIKILEALKRDGGKLKDTVEQTVKRLEDDNEKIDIAHCLQEFVDLKEHLKIPEMVQIPQDTDLPIIDETLQKEESKKYTIGSVIVSIFSAIFNWLCMFFKFISQMIFGTGSTYYKNVSTEHINLHILAPIFINLICILILYVF